MVFPVSCKVLDQLAEGTMKRLILLITMVACGCGAPFTAEMSNANAGTGSDSGVAGQGLATSGSGGARGGTTGRPGGANGVGGAAAQGAVASGSGGRGMGTGGSSSSEAGAPQTSACIVGWKGSSCDTCTGAEEPDAGASCAEVLDCYAQNLCGPTTCRYCESPDQGISDRAVQLSRAVYMCRCGAL